MIIASDFEIFDFLKFPFYAQTVCILSYHGAVIVCYQLANLNSIQELFLVYLQSGLDHYEKTGGSVVVDFLFIVTPIVGVCNCSMFCCTLHYVHSSIAIILMGKRELIALLNLSSWCLVMVERLFLAVPRGCLQFVVVVFPDHTHLLFLCYHRHIRETNSQDQC